LYYSSIFLGAEDVQENSDCYPTCLLCVQNDFPYLSVSGHSSLKIDLLNLYYLWFAVVWWSNFEGVYASHGYSHGLVICVNSCHVHK